MPVAAYGVGRKDIFTDVDPGRDVTDSIWRPSSIPTGCWLDFEHAWFCPNKAETIFTGNFEASPVPRAA